MHHHPLCHPAVRKVIERIASDHRGRPWTSHSFTGLNELASHPSGILHGEPFSVFGKIATDSQRTQRFRAELAGLRFLRKKAHVLTPTPIGPGIVPLDHSSLLLFEAFEHRRPEVRTVEDWKSIGSTISQIHQVHGDSFGLKQFNGFYGPLPQDNSPTRSTLWVDFFAERRVVPMLRSAVGSGHLPPALAHDLDQVVHRLPSLCGPEPRPTLLHGDAQQHNFVSTDSGAAIIDPAPYFGHPEMDLAQVDVFNPVPPSVLDAYRQNLQIDPGFDERRELWRLFCYLAAVTIGSTTSFGRRMLRSLADAVERYR
jgi:protein-ribulosamine 3-kinase